MLNIKPILHFLFIFLLSYITLMVIGFYAEEGYDKRVRIFGKAFFENFRSSGLVWFEQNKNPTEKHFDIKIRFINKEMHEQSKKTKTRLQTGAVTVSGWYIGFLPTILTVSLIIATPLPWKRRLTGLLWGLLLVHFFIWFQLYVQILYEFERNEFLNVMTFGSTSQKIWDALHYLFVESMGTRFVIPVFIWITAVFRKGDLEKILKMSVN